MIMLNRFFKVTVVIYGLFFSLELFAIQISDEFKAVWSGIEIIGTDKITANRIRNDIQLPIGNLYTASEAEKYRSICNNLKDNYFIGDLNCSFLLCGGGEGEAEVYLMIDVIPKSASKDQYRKILQLGKTNKVIPNKLDTLYVKMNERLSYLMSNNMDVSENYNNGHIDFSDPTLHKIALKLAKLCEQNNDLLLEIIRVSPDIEQRRRASFFLSWTTKLSNIAYIEKWNLMFDSDAGVRNNISRAYSSRMSQVNDLDLLRKLIPVYCKMAALPSHTDRNKALFSLSGLLEVHPELISSFEPECINRILYISEMSILDNVGGEAKKIINDIRSISNG